MVEDLGRYYITKFASPEMTTIEKDSQYFYSSSFYQVTKDASVVKTKKGKVEIKRLPMWKSHIPISKIKNARILLRYYR